MVASLSISASFTANFDLDHKKNIRKHNKTLFLRGFILKPTESVQILPKSNTRDL